MTLLPRFGQGLPGSDTPEGLLLSLLDACSSACCLLEASGQLVLANRAARRLLGEGSDLSLEALQLALGEAEFPRYFARCLAGEELRLALDERPTMETVGTRAARLLELTPLREAGSVRYVALCIYEAAAGADESGRELPRSSPLTGWDEQRAALVRNLEGIMRAMPIGCCILDASLRATFVNPALERLVSASAAELLGESPWRFLSPADRERLRTLHAGTESPVQLAAPTEDVQRPDGSLVSAMWHLAPLLDRDGAYRGVLMLAIDLSERVQAERALQRSEERYRSLVQTTSAIVFTCDPQGRFVVPQTEWEAYTGQPWEEHRGYGWGGALQPEDRQRTLALWQQTILRGSPYETEGRIYHKASGEYRHVHVRGAPLRDEHGVREWIGTVVDIHDRQRALDELSRLETQAREIEQASRLKDEFLANMSHELRTPLNAVLGFAELIADRVVSPDSPQHDEFVEHILDSGRHLLSLIDEVLDLTTIASGKLRLAPERISLEPLVRQVIAVFDATGRSSGVSLRSELEPELPSPYLDPARFKQVLYNYLSNALKFSPPDGEVVVRVRRAGSTQLRLEVSDRGPGITAADQARLFVEFQQLEGGIAKRHGGTGLAVTKRLVEAQGGFVGVESAPGHGSTFFAVLPLEFVPSRAAVKR